MKKKKNLLFLFLLSMIALFSLHTNVSAAKLKLPAQTFWVGAPYAYSVVADNVPVSAKLVSIKSSNSKVLFAEKYSSDVWGATVTPLKTGKSKITLTYKISGKKQSVSATFQVKKYPNAIKKLTFNGTSINLKKNKFEANLIKKQAKKITIKVTPASGWKVLNNTIEILSEGSSYKQVKNGKSVSISLKKKTVSALITLYNTKTGDVFDYMIDITK